MCNVEIDSAAVVVEGASWSVSVHDVVAVILFVASLMICYIQVVSFIRCIINKEYDWDKKLLPSKIMLTARGIIGWTLLFYFIWLWIKWNSWQGAVVWGVLILPFTAGCVIWIAAVLLFAFGYWLLYKPMAAAIAHFRKR